MVENRTPVPQHAVRAIQHMIQEGQVRPGHRLPPQRRLAERLGISRASLREALSVLETLGMVRIEAGRGAVVLGSEASDGAASGWHFADRFSELDVYQLRYALEGYSARFAALAMNETALADLRTTIDAMKASVRAADAVQTALADYAFHRRILEIFGNRAFLEVHESLRRVFLESQSRPFSRLETAWQTIAEHERILEALGQRDPDGASYLMRLHITRSAGRAGIDLANGPGL